MCVCVDVVYTILQHLKDFFFYKKILFYLNFSNK